MCQLPRATDDVGKTVYVAELSEPGHYHEAEGERMLLEAGIEPGIARCCRSHAQYDEMQCSLEELVVALADKLWKGKRVEGLELRVIDTVAALVGKERWDVYLELDGCFESVAAKGDERLECNRGA